MSEKSFIYSNIHVYRFLMNVFYGDRVKERYLNIIERIGDNDKEVLELCFGDTFLANFCKDTGRHWMGMDLNTSFVAAAKQEGFDAQCEDLMELKKWPKADVCVMVASLYHFGEDIERVIKRMINSAGKVLISEPVSNLANKNNIIGWASKRLTSTGKGEEPFRFNESSFIEMLVVLSRKLKFEYTIYKNNDLDMYVELKKK